MSILSDIDDIFAEGDELAPIFDDMMNCVNLINDCKTTKEHNKACKLLVNILGKQPLDIKDNDLFDVNAYDYTGILKSESGRLKSTIKQVLVYSPPRGGRAAIIHIFNPINDFDNLKIESLGFCCELGDRYFDIYPGTIAFDITDKKLATNLLIKHLKLFKW